MSRQDTQTGWSGYLRYPRPYLPTGKVAAIQQYEDKAVADMLAEKVQQPPDVVQTPDPHYPQVTLREQYDPTDFPTFDQACLGCYMSDVRLRRASYRPAPRHGMPGGDSPRRRPCSCWCCVDCPGSSQWCGGRLACWHRCASLKQRAECDSLECEQP